MHLPSLHHQTLARHLLSLWFQVVMFIPHGNINDQAAMTLIWAARTRAFNAFGISPILRNCGYCFFSVPILPNLSRSKMEQTKPCGNATTSKTHWSNLKTYCIYAYAANDNLHFKAQCSVMHWMSTALALNTIGHTRQGKLPNIAAP